MTIRAIFDIILAIAFIVAAWRIGVAAFTGQRVIRLFRIYGVVVATAWATFYAVSAVNSAFDVIDPHTWVNIGRAVQFFTVSLFLIWGFLFNEEKWSRANGDS